MLDSYLPCLKKPNLFIYKSGKNPDTFSLFQGKELGK